MRSLLLLFLLAGCAAATQQTVVERQSCHPEIVAYTAGDMTPPVVIKRVPPTPARPVRGKAVVEAVIDDHGNVTDVCVVEGNPEVIEAAVRAIRQWQFQPATMNGTPVAVRFLLTTQIH